MIHIQKRQPIPGFGAFIRSCNPTQWNEIHNFQKGAIYRQTREYILKEEQGGLGGYTERPLSISQESHNVNNQAHIDHFKKRSMFPQLTFVWDNFIVESRHPMYGACAKDGVMKQVIDYNRLLNPVVDYPETMFTYRVDGYMMVQEGLSPVDSDKAHFTIDTFNLNHEALCRERKTVICVIQDYSGLSDDEIRQAMSGFGYPTVVDWFLKNRHLLCP